jgi:hypothetical protein
MSSKPCRCMVRLYNNKAQDPHCVCRIMSRQSLLGLTCTAHLSRLKAHRQSPVSRPRVLASSNTRWWYLMSSYTKTWHSCHTCSWKVRPAQRHIVLNPPVGNMQLRASLLLATCLRARLAGCRRTPCWHACRERSSLTLGLMSVWLQVLSWWQSSYPRISSWWRMGLRTAPSSKLAL